MEQKQSALLVIDMQNGFLESGSPLCIAGAKATVPQCTQVIRCARKKGMPVVFVTRRYREDGSDVEWPRKAAWEAGGKPLSPSAQGMLSGEMPAEFAVQTGDYHIVKPRYSAFFHTELDLLLRRLKVQQIYLAGTTTPNCIRTTCYDGISLDYRVCVIGDCCSSQTPEIQQANLQDMENVGAEILTAGEFAQR